MKKERFSFVKNSNLMNQLPPFFFFEDDDDEDDDYGQDFSKLDSPMAHLSDEQIADRQARDIAIETHPLFRAFVEMKDIYSLITETIEVFISPSFTSPANLDELIVDVENLLRFEHIELVGSDFVEDLLQIRVSIGRYKKPIQFLKYTPFVDGRHITILEESFEEVQQEFRTWVQSLKASYTWPTEDEWGLCHY
jgi:hypothetical protein